MCTQWPRSMFTVPGLARTSPPGVGETCMHPNVGHPTHGLVLGVPAPHVVRVSHASDEQIPPKRGVCLHGAAEKTLLCPSIMPTHFHTILLYRVLERDRGKLQGPVGRQLPHTHTMPRPYLHKGWDSCQKCLGAKQT